MDSASNPMQEAVVELESILSAQRSVTADPSSQQPVDCIRITASNEFQLMFQSLLLFVLFY